MVRVITGIGVVALVVVGTWALQHFLSERPETWTTAVIIVAASAIFASLLALLILRLRSSGARPTEAPLAVARAPRHRGEPWQVDWATLAPLVAERVASLPDDVRAQVLSLNDAEPASWRAWRLDVELVRVTIGVDEVVEIGVFQVAESSNGNAQKVEAEGERGDGVDPPEAETGEPPA
jgi:hypothetical protein